jgi:pSer/pThr/pTyr-binding forkhead associated (FHA) protein
VVYGDYNKRGECELEQKFLNDFSVLYENNSTSNYLVLRTGIDNKIINYQVQMLLTNKLNGLLEFNLNYIGDDLNCFYNVTSKCTLASFMSRKRFSRDEFLMTILNIINNIYQMQNYLLYDNNILLDENFIYVEPESIDICFVYLPFLDFNNDIKAFFIKLIFKLVKFHDEYSDNYFQKILEVIKNDNFSLGNLKSLIESLLGEEIKNQASKNWTMDTNNTEDQDTGLKRIKIENELDMQVNSKFQKNEKINADKLKTSRFNPAKAEIDKVKASRFKADKAEIEKTKTDKVIADKIKSGIFKVDKTNTDKAVITRGNFRIPNSQNNKNQEQINHKAVMEIKDCVPEHNRIQGDQKSKIKPLKFARLLLQPFLLISFISTVNSNFIKMSDNPMNTVMILILIFLSVDVLVIRIINEKIMKLDQTDSCKPLQFITDIMKNRTKPKADELLSNINDKQEHHQPIANENYNGETVIIKMPKPTVCPYLKEKGGNEVVEINKNSILIGRMESFVDYVINSSAIGKIHAEILQEGEDFYVMDCNSRNGTFLNDNRIVPNTKNKVNNNDQLRFANKEFVFFSSFKPQQRLT